MNGASSARHSADSDSNCARSGNADGVDEASNRSCCRGTVLAFGIGSWAGEGWLSNRSAVRLSALVERIVQYVLAQSIAALGFAGVVRVQTREALAQVGGHGLQRRFATGVLAGEFELEFA